MHSAVDQLIEHYLEDLARSNRAPATLRAYAADLGHLGRHCTQIGQLADSKILRKILRGWSPLKPASRARKESALSAFYRWALRQGVLETNPMEKLERTRRAEPCVDGITRAQFRKLFQAIPTKQTRDRLLFRLLFETGMRIGEALEIHIEDLDLTLDDEHVRVIGKGGRRRTVLLDDPVLVRELKRYLKTTGYRHGPLFRAAKNNIGGPLRYQSAVEKWRKYCALAGVSYTLHQLRHGHATELINAGVSLPTIRKRLGHKNIQSTMLYAQVSDETADRELRAWRRRVKR